MKLFLDDTIPAPAGWVRAYTSDEAIEHLKTGTVEEISLDHDLGIEEMAGTGYTVLQWIEKEVHLHGFKPPRIMTVHSANPPATDRMLQAIASNREKGEGLDSQLRTLLNVSRVRRIKIGGMNAGKRLFPKTDTDAYGSINGVQDVSGRLWQMVFDKGWAKAI